MEQINPNIKIGLDMDILDFFMAPTNSLHKQYEALRAFFVEKLTADEIADQFHYTKSTTISAHNLT
jgi:hypothetical protein